MKQKLLPKDWQETKRQPKQVTQTQVGKQWSMKCYESYQIESLKDNQIDKQNNYNKESISRWTPQVWIWLKRMVNQLTRLWLIVKLLVGFIVKIIQSHLLNKLQLLTLC